MANSGGGPPANLFAHALARVPKLLTLQDRDPHSPTYGCFDRAFWHLKIKDFPSGMAQEFAWPLALIHAPSAPPSPYRGNPALAAWIEAGLRYAARSSHADGSCDDYFPYERAAGATAFSLLACLESYAALGLKAPELLAFFERRARWLAGRRESGRLANHEALIALCLIRMGEISGQEESWRGAADERLQRLLGWQNPEGWFDEYGGADLGYLSLTIGLLAEIERRRGDPSLREPILRAVRFAACFAHPDGTFGGAYASRNTLNYFPHGFESVGRWAPEALALNDAFAGALSAGRMASYDDDHIVGHHLWSYLLAARDWVAERPAAAAPTEGRAWFPQAGLLADRRGRDALFMSTRKGGAFKLFRDGALVAADAGASLRIGGDGGGRGKRVARAEMSPDAEARVTEAEIVAEGRLGWAKQTAMTPARLILLRGFMLTIGRFAPDLARRILQKMLITGRAPAPFRFRRRLVHDGEAWRADDEIAAEAGWQDVTDAGLAGFQTSPYVVMSRVFEPGQMIGPWRGLAGELRAVRAGGGDLRLSRRFDGSSGSPAGQRDREAAGR